MSHRPPRAPAPTALRSPRPAHAQQGGSAGKAAPGVTPSPAWVRAPRPAPPAAARTRGRPGRGRRTRGPLQPAASAPSRPRGAGRLPLGGRRAGPRPRQLLSKMDAMCPARRPPGLLRLLLLFRGGRGSSPAGSASAGPQTVEGGGWLRAAGAQLKDPAPAAAMSRRRHPVARGGAAGPPLPLGPSGARRRPGEGRAR